MPRIAVLNKDRCKPGECRLLCMRVCPKVKTGDEAITVDEDTGKPVISELLCSGCGICVKKCPFNAISIINLPEETGDPVHQYGINGFRIYNLPTPKNAVVGIVGSNGIGKTTVLKILAGELKPNLGGEAKWGEILERFRGNEIQNYLEKLALGEVKAVYKPQYVESIPRYVEGTVGDVLKERDESGRLRNIIAALNMNSCMEKDVDSLSGGELQKLAIAACLIRDGDVYLLDEPSSYLDVSERLNVARAVRELSDSNIFVIEHDLVVVDYISDYIHVIYGKPGAYGVVSNIKGVRVGINEYLAGFLRSENVRFREELTFSVAAPTEISKRSELIKYLSLEKKYPGFDLRVDEGALYRSEVLGILGPNATGKTTFVKMLADVIKPDNLELDYDLRVSYKPQYIKSSAETVRSLKLKPYFIKKLNLDHLLESRLDELSGGELQRVAVADCLSQDADLYLLDEPSAYLDVEERLRLVKYLRRFSEDNETSVLVVDHDILLIDYLADKLMVFSGESGRHGEASESLSLRDGMNLFLTEMDVSFRRDLDSGRPRANKPDSVKDREQKKRGEYYYAR
ncbi:MAG: ribosome biogenesis/translation initiation ATPase RLI [Candidatus Altiarchaeota archaeon]|nr:ribosome biogenesis/translation initiation ATPase RLI [Candidatus Altiarchaeota archaeon]